MPASAAEGVALGCHRFKITLSAFGRLLRIGQSPCHLRAIVHGQKSAQPTAHLLGFELLAHALDVLSHTQAFAVTCSIGSSGLKRGVSALATFSPSTFCRSWCHCMRVRSIEKTGLSE